MKEQFFVFFEVEPTLQHDLIDSVDNRSSSISISIVTICSLVPPKVVVMKKRGIVPFLSSGEYLTEFSFEQLR